MLLTGIAAAALKGRMDLAAIIAAINQANVINAMAAAFCTRYGVRTIAAAAESHEEPGDVSLMITKHCVHQSQSLSLCPKQAKGVTGGQGTVKAEPVTFH